MDSARDGSGAEASPWGVARSRELAAALAVELSDVASVRIDEHAGGITVHVEPYRSGARSVGWTDFGGEMVVQVGRFGGRFETLGGGEGLAYLEDVVRSVVAGRVSEVLALRRSRVVVILADGSKEIETGHEGLTGCLPLPLWPRWSRRVQYLPYRR